MDKIQSEIQRQISQGLGKHMMVDEKYNEDTGAEESD